MAKRFYDIVTEYRNSNVTSKYFFTPLHSSDTSASYRENDIEQRIRGLDWKVSVLESVQCIYWRSIPVPFRIQTEAIENDLGMQVYAMYFFPVCRGIFCCTTIKLGFKERLKQGQVGNSEPFPVTNLLVYLMNSEQNGIMQ